MVVVVVVVVVGGLMSIDLVVRGPLYKQELSQ